MSRDTKSCVSTVMPDTALVLAGGLGTRLRPAVSDRPKSLALAAGRPFLHYVLEALRRQGILYVTLCVGYLASQVEEYAGDGQKWGLVIRYSLEQVPLGTAGALRQASADLDEAFFALNGDTLFGADLTALWEGHIRAGCLATVALLRIAGKAAASARGCVRLSPDGHILSFDEKPTLASVETQNIASHQKTQNIASLLINGGVYCLEPQALAEVPAGRSVSIEREVFPRLAERGMLAGQVQQAYFADIGTPESLAAFERDVLTGIYTQ